MEGFGAERDTADYGRRSSFGGVRGRKRYCGLWVEVFIWRGSGQKEILRTMGGGLHLEGLWAERDRKRHYRRQTKSDISILVKQKRRDIALGLATVVFNPNP